ncbi:MAG TPA: FAD-dependent oxidoreductase [Solirubrobacteraceae bacterium]|jgi:NADPH-dependent 2,4-dienoyl-CoA reductase/sulfur reductase-like enzyme|nr:FAD-dependent oxidoreductase [Solirubrobacteraceae bacterium]
MSGERVVIVGAGPAGLATVRSYRECGGAAPVTIIGREPLPPYRRPPLTKEFLRGEITAEDLPLERDAWYAEHDVELRLGCEVSAIDPRGGTVQFGEETLDAAMIVLATGSEPVRPKLPGIEHGRVLSMRALADSELIAERVQAGTRALVIGSGFIGCEIAASLARIGARITLIAQEEAPQQERLGLAAALRIGDWLRELGVELVTGAEVSAIEDGRVALLVDGSRHEGEWVLLGTGARPRGALAKAAGVPVEDGAVLVDAQMRAGERLLAVGDVAFAHNASAGRRLRVEHWGDALAHGEVAGRTLAGASAAWEDVPGFWSTIGERTLKHAAWGDGYDSSELVGQDDGAFTVWYSRAGALVGVLTHDRDSDYEEGRKRIREEAAAP